MSAKDRKEDKNHPPRQGSVSTADNETQQWLHSFFHRKEAPERIEVWLLTGPHRTDRTKLIFHQDFKANEDKNPEECAYIANVIWATAQHDCNVSRRRSWYEIAVIDRHRTPHPVMRRIGPLNPMSTEMVKNGPDGSPLSDDEEEMTIGAKPMILQYLDRLVSTIERKDQALTAITGDLLLHQSRENDKLRTDRDSLMDRNMQMFFAIQDALDRKEDRDDRREDRQVQRARDKLFADGLREAGRIAGVYAPGLFRALLPQSVVQQGEQAAAQQSALAPHQQQQSNAAPDFGQSEERSYVEKFFEYLRDAKVGDISAEEKLCGDWVPIDNVMQPNPDPTRAGILRPDQVRLLVGLAKGWVHPDRVDELSPESNHPNAITGEQLMEAQSFVPQSAMACVFELLGLRADKREKATVSKTTN